MYHTGNYLQRKHLNPSIPHGSHMGAPHCANPFASPRAVDHGILRMNQTMPADTTANDKDRDIQRTGSAGFFLFRKRTTEEQRLLISQQRAAGMIAKYEFSDDKEESLNRNAKFGPGPMPSLGSCLGAQHAAFAALAERRHVPIGGRDASERRKTEVTVSKPSRPPLKSQGNIFTFDDVAKPEKKKSKSQQRIEIARATRMRLDAERAAKADSELPSEVGVDVISPGVYSVAPTMAETPSPRPSAVPTWNMRTTREIHRLC